MENHIVLQGNITTNVLYTQALRLLWEYYRNEKKSAPVMDLRQAAYIEPEAVPLLIALGDYFSKLYHSLIDIEIEEESALQNFLINIGFYGHVKKFYNIPEGYARNWLYKIRDIHKIIWLKRAE